jgi:AcrR family transcriptional regulator
VAAGGRKNANESLALALAAGATVQAAARRAGVSERTAYRRLADPDFCGQVNQARAELVRQATGQLVAAATDAAATLQELLCANQPPRIRLGAARAILELGVRLREEGELEERLRRLEALLKGGPGP